jgi:hypothetical protein
MGGACSMLGGEREIHTKENLKERGFLEGQGVDGKILLIWIVKK